MEKIALYMTFVNGLGQKGTLVVYDPKDDLEEQQIVTAMDTIVGLNILKIKDELITGSYSAKIVKATTEELEVTTA